MIVSRTEMLAIEQAVVRGWPSLETRRIDGWLARWSSGGSVRANSVATIAYTGCDLDCSIAAVVEFYRARKAIPRFVIAASTTPADLDPQLDACGWQRSGAHVTLAKNIDPAPALTVPAPGIGIVRHKAPTTAWSDIYLAGLSADRRGIALRLVEGTPEPRTFYSAIHDGQVIASGLSIRDGALASVQCMATLLAARRTGAVTTILTAIEGDALAHQVTRLYLQTDAANIGAISVYERFGFHVADRYHMRELTS